MDWRAVLSSEAEDVEKNEELLERLYSFFLQTDLPQQGSSVSELVEDKSNLLKLVSLLRSVVRVKGLEAQAAEEELRELQEKYDSTTANVGTGTSERDLLNQANPLRQYPGITLYHSNKNLLSVSRTRSGSCEHQSSDGGSCNGDSSFSPHSSTKGKF